MRIQPEESATEMTRLRIMGIRAQSPYRTKPEKSACEEPLLRELKP